MRHMTWTLDSAFDGRWSLLLDCLCEMLDSFVTHDAATRLNKVDAGFCY